MLVGRLLDRLALDVVRDDNAGHRPLGLGYSQRAVDDMANLRRYDDHLYVLVGDVLEQAEQVNLLLIGAAERGPCLLTDEATTGW